MASVASATQALDGPAPISQILPVISQVLSVLATTFTVIATATVTIASYMIYPILFLSPLPLILYILSPVLVLGSILLDALIVTPYYAVSSLAGIVYPLYVLLGIACLSGAFMGVSGRIISRMLNAVVYPPRFGNGAKEILKLQVEQEKRRATRANLVR